MWLAQDNTLLELDQTIRLLVSFPLLVRATLFLLLALAPFGFSLFGSKTLFFPPPKRFGLPPLLGRRFSLAATLGRGVRFVLTPALALQPPLLLIACSLVLTRLIAGGG
jgi:hypothetical protein